MSPAKASKSVKRATPSRVKKDAPAKVPSRQSTREEVEYIEERRPDGTRLVRALNQRMCAFDMRPRDVARELDMSYSYFNTLVNEPWRFAGIDRRFMRNIARFLGINTIMAYQYAGFFEDEDVYVDITAEALLRKAHGQMEKDPIYSVYVPEYKEMEQLPVNIRLLVFFMYSEIETLRMKSLQDADSEESGKPASRK